MEQVCRIYTTSEFNELNLYSIVVGPMFLKFLILKVIGNCEFCPGCSLIGRQSYELRFSVVIEAI